MRPRVGIALGRPFRTRALSASTSTRQPRRIPPDFPRRAPIYGQTAVDDSAALAPRTEPDTEQDKEKPRKRVVKSPGSPNKTPPPATPTKVPVGPEAIWTSKSLGEGGESRALPPDDMLQDALAQLLVTLQPQTQYRAAYANGGVPLVEPTLALYCPIEGGDYVIDDTVKELAARINGDVIVIDAVQLAAGEHGSFGKAASILNFPQNPLHFPSSGSPNSRSRPVNEDPDTDDDDLEDDERDSEVHRVTFGNVSAVAVPVRSVRVRSGASNPYAPAPSSSSSKNTPAAQSELKFFFESIINAHVPSAGSSGSLHRPRIIYLRDFSLLAPSAHIWYPYLLAAIRARRQGPLLRPSIPVPFPTTLVLGVSPSLVPTFPSSTPPSAPSGLMNMLLGQRSHRVTPTPTRTETGHGGEERADRLRDRLRKWSRSGSIINDLPPFTSPSYRGSNPGPAGFMSANGFTSIFGAHPSTAGDRSNDALGDKGGVSVGTGSKSGYFRVCGVVPAIRDEARERSVRRARRAEVNALVARMAVGAVGGKVVEAPATPTIPAKPAKPKKETEEKDKKEPTAGSQSTEVAPGDKMVEDWSRKLLDWHAARRLADRALACAVLSGSSITEPVAVLEEVTPPPETSEEAAATNSMPPPTAVSWDAIRTAWDAVRLSLGYGEKLADGATEASTPAAPESTTAPTPLIPPTLPAPAPASSSSTPTVPKWSGIGSPREPVPWIDAALAPPTILHIGKPPEPGAEDEVVEEIKNDPDLDTHEERLLGSELQTTFSQVHLPDTTIDSVRTLVSLPLLYPAAFRSGILAQHAMTGALLFGPPGTGKTLLARALAKESGARMMVYVGEGEKLVRSVFSLARRLSPCIVFLDEIDALLGARSSRDTGGAASAHRGLVTEFMQEMDGLRSSASSNIVVVGATNRPFDLDDAVLRRLPRRLLIDLPGVDEREAILNIMLRGEEVSSDVDVKALAKQTEGFSGSDLKNLVVSAALDAVKEKVELPWRTGSAVEKKKEVANGEKTVDVSTVEATNVAPDATSTETPVPGTRAVSEPASDTSASTEAPTAEEPTSGPKPTEPKPATEAPAAPSRTLTSRHFTRALKEITPSASEALGTLADLRKWNAEFGGGERKKLAKAWGGRFGFGGSGKKPSEEGAGRVVREDAE